MKNQRAKVKQPKTGKNVVYRRDDYNGNIDDYDKSNNNMEYYDSSGNDDDDDNDTDDASDISENNDKKYRQIKY